jgi:hypothetical protein
MASAAIIHKWHLIHEKMQAKIETQLILATYFLHPVNIAIIGFKFVPKILHT